jgi:hypothetical protein
VYINPVYLPQVSNREDYLLTVSLFDDDTGQPVKVDGCTTVLNQPFTGNAWTVTDGGIVTTSMTPMTIPVFPVTLSSLLAQALTVGLNLAINPGDPITIADTATGFNTMVGYVTSYSPSNGALVVQIGVAFLFEIRRTGARFDGAGYIPWYDFGVPDEYGPLLSATNGNGVSIIDVGVIQILIPANIFQKLHGGTYSASLIMTDGINTRQVFVGQLPVQHGNVSKMPVAAMAGPVWN